MQIIILAGGSGERFWPLSTKESPKQFLKLFDNISLIRQTYDRLADFVSPEDIFVVTSQMYKARTMEELPELPEKNIFGEPFRRNTAAACLAGTFMAKDDESILVLPADHRIPDKEKFWEYVQMAEAGLKAYGGIFTFGMKPTRAETGYGYIEAGERFSESVLNVACFREKPDKPSALSYVEAGNFYWNSGMFLWNKTFFLEEMKKYAPDVYAPLEKMNPYDTESVEGCYGACESISIDYALMERSETVRVVPMELEWSDVGHWESIRELEGYTKDDEMNCFIESENVYTRSESAKKIGVVGLNNIIVVETEEGILVCREEDAQKVREISKYFKLQ